MNGMLRFVAAPLFGAVAACCAFAAWRAFPVVPFIVADAVGDLRQMRDDGPQSPYWMDFIGYVPFYLIPSIFGFFSLVSGLFAISLLGGEKE